MGEREDILREVTSSGDLWRLAEEVSEGAVVGVRGAEGSGAALLLGEEGVESSLPRQS